MTHRRVPIVEGAWSPAYVVWELTLRCDHACHHCGSRAGLEREGELSTDEALRLVDDLARLGTREVVLMGGEAYLHPALFEVLAALRDRGIVSQLTTGGKAIDRELARRMASAGLRSASVSIDGLEATHDALRASRGSSRAAFAALAHLRDAGIRIGSNINLNRRNQAELEPLYERLREARIEGWQIQLTVPVGRAADHPALVLQPYQLLALVPRVARLKERAFADGIRVMPGDNLGYFGPEEATLRSLEPGGSDFFAGCQAGRLGLGIESQGAVKGCASLPSEAYVGGSVRETPLAEIWRASPKIGFARARTRDALWGFCGSCDFGEICLGGCTFTAHALFGRPGNNPYCHYRARTLAKRGLRERIVPASSTPGRTLELVLEPLDAEPEPEATAERLESVGAHHGGPTNTPSSSHVEPV